MENFEFRIMLLNFATLKDKKGDKLYKLGYVFFDKKMFSDNEKFIGVNEQALFTYSDLEALFDINDMFKEYKLVGNLVSDYKNPLNKRFVPIKLIDVKANVEISLSE